MGCSVGVGEGVADGVAVGDGVTEAVPVATGGRGLALAAADGLAARATLVAAGVGDEMAESRAQAAVRLSATPAMTPNNHRIRGNNGFRIMHLTL